MAKRKPSNLNLLVAVDKPQGCTSHDVVARARRALQERRIGHAGTLDPLATGVVVLGVGQATRLLGRLTGASKSYLAEITFGFETDTDDAEGREVRRVECGQHLLDEHTARQALEASLGDSMQVPPAYSAISVNGVRSYRLARSGQDVELEARPICVYSAQLLSIRTEMGLPVWTVAYTVSKGTYIRALARDLGRAVSSAAHISSLRRTASGSIGLSHAVQWDELSPASAHASALDPISALGISALPVSNRHLSAISCGQSLAVDDFSASLLPQEGELVGLVAQGCLHALARVEGKQLRMDSVFPFGIEGVVL